LDLDGTLLEADDTIRPATIDALAAAESAGLAVCLATGRSAVETIPLSGYALDATNPNR